MAIYTLGVLSGNLYDREYVDMFTKANIISENVSQVWENSPEVTADKYNDFVENSLASTNIRGVIVNTSYTILYDTNKEAALIGKVFMRDVLNDALSGEQTSLTESLEGGGKNLSVAVPVLVNNTVVGGVYLTQNITSIDTTVAATRNGIIVFSALIILLIGMLSVGMSYIITAPLEEFNEAAKRISKGDFSMRMKETGRNRDFVQMSKTFNYMCDELEHLEEQRRKFVSDASHELKTPMAGIKLICDSIINTDGMDMATIKEFLGDMSDEVDRLTRIIERLLTLTRLNSDAASLKISEVDIAVLIDNVVKKITPIADKKDVVVYADLSKNIDRSMALDYDRIYEAIFNITDNAVKYTPEGGYVHIELKDEADCAVVMIEDNGPGIPEEERDKIFDRFYRLDDSRARDTGGTGLGLAIAKEAVAMHGGTIEVTSPQDTCGSIFAVRLPYAQVAAKEVAEWKK